MLQRKEIFRRGFDDFREFLNPYIANRAALAQEPTRLTRAQDGCLLDPDGKIYEDFHGTQMFGHRHPAITAAVQDYLGSDAPSWYPSRVNPFTGALARRLCERTGYSNVYFGLSGSDSVEAALKLARAATKRPRFLGLDRAYHGCGMGSMALMHPGALRDPFGPHLPGTAVVPMGDVATLERELAQGDVAAVLVEPIQGEGGVRPIPRPFVEALCALTERHGALLIADEVQTGLGRSGHFLLSETWPRRPEIVLLAKALAGGITPLSATLSHRALFEKAYGASFEDAEGHNSTFSNNALAAVASLATLDLLTDELISSVRERGDAFRKAIADALADNPLFVEVRGAGLMVGVQLRQPDHPWVSFEQFGYPHLNDHATIGPLLANRLYKRGYFTFVCGHDWSILRLQPRFTVPPGTLTAFVDALREELAFLHDAIT